MDALDFALFRELSRHRVLVWGALAPRLSVPDLAEALNVDPTTVRARLRAWETSGFLRSFAKIPNPSLFGFPWAAGAVRAKDLQAKPALLEALSMVDGVLHVIEHVGPWIGFSTIDDGGLDRRSTLISRLPGAAEVMEMFLVGSPPCTWKPSPTGWRVLKAITSPGTRPIKELANEAGVSLNTFHAHEARLQGSGAVLLVPELDFRHYSGAVVARVFATLEEDADAHAVTKIAEGAVPDGALIASREVPRAGPPISALFFTAHLPSMPAVEDLQRALEEAAGVTEVEVYYPRSSLVFRHWFDHQMAQATRAR